MPPSRDPTFIPGSLHFGDQFHYGVEEVLGLIYKNRDKGKECLPLEPLMEKAVQTLVEQPGAEDGGQWWGGPKMGPEVEAET